jgi:hypothetical protein
VVRLGRYESCQICLFTNIYSLREGDFKSHNTV